MVEKKIRPSEKMIQDADKQIQEALDAAEREAHPPLASQDEKVAWCAALDQNDTGNAQRLICHFGKDVMFVREHGTYRWDGTHWEMIGGKEQMVIFAQKTAKLIEEEANFLAVTPREQMILDAARSVAVTEDMSDEDKVKLADAEAVRGQLQRRKSARRKYAISSGNNGKINGMISQAEPHLTVGPEDLDKDPLAFNVQNGTLVFRRMRDENSPEQSWLDMELLSHDRAMLISKCAPVTYDPSATCPRWEAFLEKFQPDEDRRVFLQVYFAIGMTGLTDEQKLIYMYGTGANGKSTMVEAICRLMGAYAGQLNPESVTGSGHRRGDQATPDLATLVGKRLVRVSELPKGQAVKEDLIKGLTGGEPIMVRHLNKGFFDMTPIFKAVMSGNDMPYVTGTDWGIWRRLKALPDHQRASVRSQIFGDEAKGLGPLIQNMEVLKQSLALVKNSGDYGGSAMGEYANRVQTSAAKLQMFQNQMEALKINLGETLLPLFNQMLEQLGKVVNWMSDLAKEYPGLAKSIGVAVAAAGALVTSAGLVVNTIAAAGIVRALSKGGWTAFKLLTGDIATNLGTINRRSKTAGTTIGGAELCGGDIPDGPDRKGKKGRGRFRPTKGGLLRGAAVAGALAVPLALHVAGRQDAERAKADPDAWLNKFRGMKPNDDVEKAMLWQHSQRIGDGQAPSNELAKVKSRLEFYRNADTETRSKIAENAKGVIVEMKAALDGAAVDLNASPLPEALGNQAIGVRQAPIAQALSEKIAQIRAVSVSGASSVPASGTKTGSAKARPARALGGGVRAGQETDVNEHGRGEVLVTSLDGRVLSHSDSVRAVKQSVAGSSEAPVSSDAAGQAAGLSVPGFNVQMTLSPQITVQGAQAMDEAALMQAVAQEMRSLVSSPEMTAGLRQQLQDMWREVTLNSYQNGALA